MVLACYRSVAPDFAFPWSLPRTDCHSQSKRVIRHRNPRWGVIACLLPTSYLMVDAARDKHLCRTWIQQKVIDPDACVTTEGIAKVIPEGIHRFIRVQL